MAETAVAERPSSAPKLGGDVVVETRNLVGLTLPTLAISSSRKITRLLRKPEYFGDLRIG